MKICVAKFITKILDIISVAICLYINQGRSQPTTDNRLSVRRERSGGEKKSL